MITPESRHDSLRKDDYSNTELKTLQKEKYPSDTTDRINPRILIIAASPRNVGGQSVMAQRLINDLARDGICVDFLPVDPKVPGILRLLDKIKFIRTLLRSFFYILSLIRNVPNYEVVHIFSASYSSFLISPAPALLVAHLLGKRIILNYHSGEAEDHLRTSGRMTKWLFGLADCIVVPSEYLVSVFARFGIQSIAIPNHIDTCYIRFKERHFLYPRIIVARTLDSLYNIPCALKTFRLVQDKHPKAELTILGDGPQKKGLEDLSSRMNLVNVTFQGFAKRSEMPRLYDRADVFLNTSSIDNMPVSILEAFNAGLPIISTNAGGIPYLVTDEKNGLLANVDDHVALAEKLLDLIDNPSKVKQLSRAGHEEIKKYTWNTVGPDWILLYQNMSCTHYDRRSTKRKPCQSVR